MTRIISVISGKGGVGKTTLVSNLGAALAKKGKNVIIVDGNVTTPNLSLHLGIPFYPVTLHDVLKKKAPIESAIYHHPESGLRIIPASLSTEALKDVSMEKFQASLLNLLGKADIVIVDCAAGLGKEALTAMSVADELIIVTNPELPAVTDALKAIKLAEENGTKVLGVVVNRVKGLKHELSLNEIKAMLEVPIISVIPEDMAVPRSIAKRIPVIHHKPNSKASIEFHKLASRIVGEPWVSVKRKSWLERLFFWLT
ncbi:MAG: cell division ATPase MinD [Candidatus Aenigmatarchaeota archaeon]